MNFYVIKFFPLKKQTKTNNLKYRGATIDDTISLIHNITHIHTHIYIYLYMFPSKMNVILEISSWLRMILYVCLKQCKKDVMEGHLIYINCLVYPRTKLCTSALFYYRVIWIHYLFEFLLFICNHIVLCIMQVKPATHTINF